MPYQLVSKIVDGKRVTEQVELTQSEIDAIEAAKPTLEQLKTEYLAKAKAAKIAWFKSNYDDFTMREVRTGETVPQELVDAGVAKDVAYDKYKLDVDACETIEELKAIGV